MDIIIYAGRVSRCVKRECDGRIRSSGVRIRVSGRNFDKFKKEFGEEEEELVKVVELRKLEQGGKTMEEFVQEFKRAARGSGYERRPLVEKFKRGMNGVIRRKLIEAKNQPGLIE